jgi:hypothetical protein
MSSSKKGRSSAALGEVLGALRDSSERLLSAVRERGRSWIPGGAQQVWDFVPERLLRLRDDSKKRVGELAREVQGRVTPFVRPIRSRVSRGIAASLDLPTRDDLRGLEDRLRAVERRLEDIGREKAA